MRLRLFAVAVLVVAAVPALAVGSQTKTTKLQALLTGTSEVPKGAVTGTGESEITITGNKICWAFTEISGIGKALASHIHKGKPGVAGPVVVPLGGAFKPKGCTTSPMAKAILAHPGNYYVNIHTAKFAAGAIRGQLSNGTKLEAELKGSSEVPKGPAGADGAVDLVIDGNRVCWLFYDVKGIGKATASHIHKGAAGSAGPVVVPLGGAFQPSGCTNSPTAKAILAHPEDYYVNIHTAKFPAGAIRGQLEKES